MLTVAGLHVPVMPFVEVAGNTGAVLPVQIVCDVPKLNVGVIFGLTATANVAVFAHNPASGVKVYTPLAWLFTTAGFHVPVTPLVEVPGNTGTVPFAQIVNEDPKGKPGIVFGVTVTAKVVAVAHCPAVGVKVYTPEAVLLAVAGLHVPLMPSDEVAGNAGTDPFTQMASDVPKANVGVTLGTTVTVKLAGTAHNPAVGVNVYVAEF